MENQNWEKLKKKSHNMHNAIMLNKLKPFLFFHETFAKYATKTWLIKVAVV